MALAIAHWGGGCGASGLKRDEKETKYHSVLCAFLHVRTTLKGGGGGRSKNRKTGHLGPKNRLEKCEVWSGVSY